MTSLKNNFYFEYQIIPDHYIMKNMPRLSEIEFKSEKKNGQKKLTGFIVKIKNSTFKKAEEISEMKAIRLTNYLSFTQGRYFSYWLQQHTSDVKSGGQHIGISVRITGDIIRTINFDHTPKQLTSILKRDSKFNQQLTHYSRGLRSFQDKDPITMIREFYQVFDERKIKKKYKLIRHLVSHNKLDNKEIKKIKTIFPKLCFDPRPNQVHLDLTSKTNMKILNEIANELKLKASTQLRKRKIKTS